MNGYDPDVIVNDNYITIKKVNKSHSGLYQCLAEDGSKTPAMEAINVIVHCKLILVLVRLKFSSTFNNIYLQNLYLNINLLTFFMTDIPEVEVKKDIVHTGESIDSEMTCIVSAYPEALITWYKDGKEIIHKKGSIMLHHGIMKGNKTKHVLKILHTSIKDFGTYKCRAENTIGQDSKSIILTGSHYYINIYILKNML